MPLESLPQIRFPKFSDTWSVNRLVDLSKGGFSNGVFNDTEKKGSGYKLINVKDMYVGNSISVADLTLLNIDEKEFKNNKVLKGDVFFTRSSIVAEGIAYSNIYLGDYEDVTYDGHLMKMTPDPSKVLPQFLFYVLKTFSSRKQFIRRGKISTMTTIGQNDIAPVKLLIPTLEEQKKIADFLSSVDKKISLLKEKHALLTQYKKGVMQKLFKQEIRFKDDNGNAFPNWELKKGNKIFDAISNKNHNSDLPILAITQEHGAIPRDLINYQVQVTEGSVAGYKVVDIGDFIISLRSFQGGIEYSNYKGICSPAYIILRPSIKVNDNFYRYYLKTGSFIQEMKKRLEGIRDGKILSYKYFSEINLPNPCVEEQHKIAEFLGALDVKIKAVNEQIELTQTFKKGLLQQMFV